MTSKGFIAPSLWIQASINFHNYSARQTNFLRIDEKVLLYSLLKQCRQKGTMALRIKIIALWIRWINWRNHQRTFSGPSVVCREHRLSENKCNLRQIGDKKGKLKPSGSLCESVDKCEWQENIGKLHASSVSTRKRSEPVKDYLENIDGNKFKIRKNSETSLWNTTKHLKKLSQPLPW